MSDKIIFVFPLRNYQGVPRIYHMRASAVVRLCGHFTDEKSVLQFDNVSEAGGREFCSVWLRTFCRTRHVRGDCFFCGTSCPRSQFRVQLNSDRRVVFCHFRFGTSRTERRTYLRGNARTCTRKSRFVEDQVSVTEWCSLQTKILNSSESSDFLENKNERNRTGIRH